MRRLFFLIFKLAIHPTSLRLSLERALGPYPSRLSLFAGRDGRIPGHRINQRSTDVRFVREGNYHTTAAYRPANASHSLRIPTTAKPWSSDALQPSISR